MEKLKRQEKNMRKLPKQLTAYEVGKINEYGEIKIESSNYKKIQDNKMSHAN